MDERVRHEGPGQHEQHRAGLQLGAQPARAPRPPVLLQHHDGLDALDAGLEMLHITVESVHGQGQLEADVMGEVFIMLGTADTLPDCDSVLLVTAVTARDSCDSVLLVLRCHNEDLVLVLEVTLSPGECP